MKESKLWFWHLMSGLALVLLLGAHTIIQHFDNVLARLGLLPAETFTSGAALTGSLNFQYAVLPRMQSVCMTVIYLLLVVVGLYHGLYGLRSIVYELKIPAGAKRGISVLILIVGLLAAVYGVWTILAGHLNPPGMNTAAANAVIGG